MAYANLVGVTCADKTEMFCRMRDFICKRNGTYDYSSTGIGWTLVESSYSVDEDNPAINDWYVIYSAGESTDEDMFFQIRWISSYLKIQGYQAWNTTTHAGGNQYNTGNNFYALDAETSKDLWVYGDLDAVFCIYQSSSDYRASYFGYCDPAFTDIVGTVATCSSSISSGSDVSIEVDSAPSDWAVGREIYIRTTHTDNTATVEIEKAEIKTLSGDTITVDLVNSYTADAKLSTHVGYFVQNGYNVGGGNIFLINAAGTVASTVAAVPAYNSSIAGTVNDPGGYENRFASVPLFLGDTNGVVGKLKNVERIGQGALSVEDVLEEPDGTEWRFFEVYSGFDCVVKEV